MPDHEVTFTSRIVKPRRGEAYSLLELRCTCGHVGGRYRSDNKPGMDSAVRFHLEQVGATDAA